MDELHGKVRLKDVLRGSGQSVSEEQAWALCYQGSCKLKQIILCGGYFPALRGAEHLYIHLDGAVSFVDVSDAKEPNLSEKKIIERLGSAVYTALDWGLDSEVERVLSDSLDNLLFYMLGLHTPSSNSPARRITFTLNDIIKECTARLFVPSEASAHYRDVCRMLYAEYKDIHRLLQTIQVTKQSLTRLDSPKTVKDDVLVMYNWSALWSRVMEELRLGVNLRSVNQRTYNVLPVQYTLTPYELLMDDIRLKRYVLRPVEIWTRENSKDDSQDYSLVMDDDMDMTWSNVMHDIRLGVGLRSVDQRSYPARPVEYTLTPYELLMEDIRSKRYVLRTVKPKIDQNKSSRSAENVLDLIRTYTLKPASERKLKERSEEEPSLHDLLMSEIKSSKALRSTWDTRRSLTPDEVKISINFCPAQRDYSSYSCRTRSRWSCMPVIEVQDLGTDGRVSWHRELSHESSPEQKSSDLTSSSTELSFFPVFTSSQVDLRMNNISNCERHMSYIHRRSNSCEGSLQGGRRRQSWRSPNIRLPPTISELIPRRRALVKTEMLELASSKGVPGYKACSSCYQKRLFFSWIFSCRFCDRTICPKCHIELLMPFKQCLHLPVSFFKALVLTRENDPFCQSQKNRMFLREVMNWDYSSIPLVFEPKDLSEDLSFCKRMTYSWTSMDICIKCEEYILDILDTSPQSDFRDSSLKSRSMSESFTMLLRS